MKLNLNLKKSKVFCSTCANYEKDETCLANPNLEIVDSWYMRSINKTYSLCSVKNEHNNCKDYQDKIYRD